MANLAFNRNGMLSKPKPMEPGLSPPIMGQKPMQPGPTIGGLGGSANDLAPAGVATRPPMMGTDRIPGKPMLGGPTMGGRPPEDFGGMGGMLNATGDRPAGGPGEGGMWGANALIPTDPNAPPGGGGARQALQTLFGRGMPSGGMPPQGAPQFSGFGGAPGGGGVSAPAPPMGGGMTGYMDPRMRRRPGFDPGLR